MKYTFFVNNSSPVAFRQRVLAFAALFVFCGLCAPAYGQERVVQFTNNSIHPHTVTVNYPDDVCAVTAPSYAISAGTNTVTFSAGTASPFQIIRQSESEDCSITADFLPNTKVLAVNTVTQGFRPALTVA